MALATAWSRPAIPTASKISPDAEVEDGESDDRNCSICYEPLSNSLRILYFIPCSHAACESCVQKLRRGAVLKDVKGVACPYCRQTVENYSSTKPERAAFQKQVNDNATSHLTNTRFVLTVGKGCPKGHPHVPTPYGRNGIVSIGGENDYFPPPHVTGAAGPGFKANKSEDSLLDNFQGQPLKPTDNLLAMAETSVGSRNIHYNLRNLPEKRRRILLKQLLELIVPHAKRLATHLIGNYTMQRLLGYASQYRMEQVNGECGFTALVRAMCKNKSLPDVAGDQKGTFVIQKMIDCLRGALELKLVMDSVEGKLAKMAFSTQSLFCVERIVEVCIVSISRPAERQPYAPVAEATKCLSRIAAELCATRETAIKVAQNQVVNHVLIECLRWAATEPQTRALLLNLAKRTPEFAETKSGRRFAQGLLSLDIPEVAETMVDSLLGEPERPVVGHLASLATDGRDLGQRLVLSLLATPCVSDKHRAKVVGDMLEAAAQLPDFHDIFTDKLVLHAFCFGLSLLPEEMAEEQLDILQTLHSYGPSLPEAVRSMRSHFCLPLPASRQGGGGGTNSSAPAPNTAQPMGPQELPIIEQQSPLEVRSAHPSMASQAAAPPGPVPAEPSSGEEFPPLTQAAGPSSSADSVREWQELANTETSTAAAAVPAASTVAANAGTGAVAGSTLKKANGEAEPSKKSKKKKNSRTGLGLGGEDQGTATGGDTGLKLAVNGTAQPDTKTVAEEQAEVDKASSKDAPADASSSGTEAAVEVAANGPDGASYSSLESPTPTDPVICAQCSMKPACVVVLACRHLSLCWSCSGEASSCPLCAVAITRKLLVEVDYGAEAPSLRSRKGSSGILEAAGQPDPIAANSSLHNVGGMVDRVLGWGAGSGFGAPPAPAAGVALSLASNSSLLSGSLATSTSNGSHSLGQLWYTNAESANVSSTSADTSAPAAQVDQGTGPEFSHSLFAPGYGSSAVDSFSKREWGVASANTSAVTGEGGGGIDSGMPTHMAFSVLESILPPQPVVGSAISHQPQPQQQQQQQQTSAPSVPPGFGAPPPPPQSFQQPQPGLAAGVPGLWSQRPGYAAFTGSANEAAPAGTMGSGMGYSEPGAMPGFSLPWGSVPGASPASPSQSAALGLHGDPLQGLQGSGGVQSMGLPYPPPLQPKMSVRPAPYRPPGLY